MKTFVVQYMIDHETESFVRVDLDAFHDFCKRKMVESLVREIIDQVGYKEEATEAGTMLTVTLTADV